MIQKFYEISCDMCGNCDHPARQNMRGVIETWRKHGGIVTQDGKHFCSKECYQTFKQNGGKSKWLL